MFACLHEKLLPISFNSFILSLYLPQLIFCQILQEFWSQNTTFFPNPGLGKKLNEKMNDEHRTKNFE